MKTIFQNSSEKPQQQEGQPAKKENSALVALAKGADHVVGTLFFGTIGQIARYAEDVPVVGHIGKYVGENIRDGYVVADQRILRKEMAKAIIDVTKAGSVPPNPEMLRQMAVKFGVPEGMIGEIQKMAEAKMPQQGTQPFPAPAVAG